jgi:hypothetical protein
VLLTFPCGKFRCGAEVRELSVIPSAVGQPRSSVMVGGPDFARSALRSGRTKRNRRPISENPGHTNSNSLLYRLFELRAVKREDKLLGFGAPSISKTPVFAHNGEAAFLEHP